LTHSLNGVSRFSIEGIEVSRAILGCDGFVSWLHEGGDSPFRNSNGNLDVSKVLGVMKECTAYGVTGVDLSPPLIEAFKRLQAETAGNIVGLGALQEWTCKNLTIEGVPLENYSEEIKATVRSRLPRGHLKCLERSETLDSLAKSFFLPKRSARPLTAAQIDSIRIKPDFFEKRLRLYKRLNVDLVQFGGGTADWLVAIGRVDLLERLSTMIRRGGFKPLLIGHWTSMILPVVGKRFDVAGYIVPLSRSWGLLTLAEAIKAIKDTGKPVIAMKVLARGALANDLEGAFTFVFKKAGIAAVMVGVSSELEARQTFSTLARVLNK
jgi:hypothetical protein